jgi:hypothetical protein
MVFVGSQRSKTRKPKHVDKTFGFEIGQIYRDSEYHTSVSVFLQENVKATIPVALSYTFQCLLYLCLFVFEQGKIPRPRCSVIFQNHEFSDLV